MTLEVRVRPEAEEDIADAATWYEDQLPGLGQDFLDQVLEKFLSIAKQPEMFPVVYKDIRRALLNRFPFAIYYRKETDAIVVLAVIHGSRNPRHWKKRT